MSEQMQMEDAGMGFLDMPGGMEPPMVQPEMSHQQVGMAQYHTVLEKVVSRFKGGISEIVELIKADEQDIKDFKANQGQYADTFKQVDIDNDTDDPADFLQGSIPGESLTGNFKDDSKGQLGAYPWETPPEMDSLEEAFDSVVNNKNNDETVKTNILKLLEAGIPSEALARTIGFQGFLNGTWTVDISELIVIPLMFEFVADCMEEGIDVRIFNDFDDDEVSGETVLEIMEDTNPEKLSLIKQEADMLERMPPQEDMNLEPEPIESFLDMEEV